jgi:hypothetical protein
MRETVGVVPQLKDGGRVEYKEIPNMQFLND